MTILVLVQGNEGEGGNGGSWTPNQGGGTQTDPNGGPPSYTDAVVPETGTLQILLGEGEFEGLSDGLKSVFLDDTPIQNSNGSFNFKGVALALVAGTNSQAAVKGVSSVESETAVGVQVSNGAPVTRTITSNPSAVRVRISIPQFKVVSTTDGNSSGNSVQIKIERQNASWNGGAWENVPLESNGVISGGPFSTKYTKGYRVDLPISGSWQIRVTRISSNDADAYHMSQTWWEAYTEITDAKLRYPNSAVLSLRVNSKQFRQIPRVSCRMKLRKIQVPTNYTPATQNSDGTWNLGQYAISGPGTTGGVWDGTFKTAWSSNPAWVFYDAAINTRFGAGTFLGATQLDKWSLYSIGQWCDQSVQNGQGINEPRMTCNLYLQGQQNAIKALSQLASVFWGMAYYAQGQVFASADADASPVMLFTNANVQDGKFSYEGTARQARHTAAAVSFINPNLGWATDMAVYEDAAGIARYGYNALEVSGIGCTSPGQALRLAKYLIVTELMTPETVTFNAGLPGSVLKPGDIIQINDQFRANSTRLGGRTAAGSTTTVIQLDAPTTIGSGAYTMKLVMDDGTVATGTVLNAPGTYSAITLVAPLSAAPGTGCVWVMQAGTSAATYRVVSISRSSETMYAVTALLHNSAKYAALGLSATDVVPKTYNNPGTPSPTGLSASVVTRVLKERQVQNIEASWTPDSAVSYIAEASRDYGPWQQMAVSGCTAILEGVDPGSWVVRVSGVWRGGVSPATTTTLSIVQTTTLPPWIGYSRNTNLIKNGNSEDVGATGYEAAGLNATVAYAGTKSRKVDSSTTAYVDLQITDFIATGEGETFSMEGQIKVAGVDLTGTGAAVVARFWQADKTTQVATAITNAATSSSSWTKVLNSSFTIPAGACYVTFHLYTHQSPGASRTVYFDNLYAERIQTSAKAALDALAVIASDSWLSKNEKPQVISNWADLNGTWSDMVNKASAAGVSYTAFNSAMTTLSGYLSGLSPAYSDTTQDTAIVPATWSANWAAAYNERVKLLNAITAAAQGDADYADALARSSYNLVKNSGSGNITPPAGSYEAAGLSNYGSSTSAPAFSGSGYGRVVTTPSGGSAYLPITPVIECQVGDQFYLSGLGAITSGSGNGTLLIQLTGPGGAQSNFRTATVSSTVLTAPTAVSMSVTVPSGYVGIQLMLALESASAGAAAWFNRFYLTKKISAGVLEADLGIFGVIRSGGGAGTGDYVAGTSSAAPQGFKVSGVPFTTTFLDGTTDASCQMELGGSANIGGYKAAVVVNNAVGSTTSWSSAGTYNWTCPAGITSVEITLQGGGGNGGSSSGGGGGGGAYIRKRVTVVPGTVYTVVVGGAAAASTMSGSGFSTVTANPGANGASGGGGGTGGASVYSSGGAGGATLGTSGSDCPWIAYEPEVEWDVPGAGGAGGFDSVTLFTKGGSCGRKVGGNTGGRVTPSVWSGGGGGGASVMGNGGSGGSNGAVGNVGGTGAGGGGGAGAAAGGAGGVGFARIRY